MGATTQFSLLLLTFLGVLLLCTKPLGSYIADVMDGRPNFALRAGAVSKAVCTGSAGSVQARR